MEVRSLCQRQIGPRGREQGASSNFKANGILKRKIILVFKMVGVFVFGVRTANGPLLF